MKSFIHSASENVNMWDEIEAFERLEKFSQLIFIQFIMLLEQLV